MNKNITALLITAKMWSSPKYLKMWSWWNIKGVLRLWIITQSSVICIKNINDFEKLSQCDVILKNQYVELYTDLDA